MKKERNRRRRGRRGRTIYSSSPMHLRACKVCSEPTRWTPETCILHTHRGQLAAVPKNTKLIPILSETVRAVRAVRVVSGRGIFGFSGFMGGYPISPANCCNFAACVTTLQLELQLSISGNGAASFQPALHLQLVLRLCS